MSESWSDPDFNLIVKVVGNYAGLDFMPERQASVEMGIRRAMARAKISSLPQYASLIDRDEERLTELMNELTVGETYFFREPAHFQFIRDVLIPEYKRPEHADRSIRVWSAGCSSGEEPYSLAMLFDEEALANRLFLLATDLSWAALEKARRACYGDWSFRGESGHAARRHMRRRDNHYEVVESIRKWVRFAPLNLASDRYPALIGGPWEMDLIFCRNVLIYFDRQTVSRVARRLYDSLTPGGWLITASSDPTLTEAAPFEVVVTSFGVFHHRTSTPPVLRPRFETIDRLRLPNEIPPRVALPSPVPAPGPRNALSSPVATSRKGQGTSVDERQARETLLATAREDLAQGRYERVVAATGPLRNDVEACVLHVRALANLDVSQAEQVCTQSLSCHPLSCELSYLRSMLLADLGKLDEACTAARRVLYLDRTLAIVHFFLGGLLRRQGHGEGARRAYRNAQELCAVRPPQEEVPLSDGELAGGLAEAARLHIERLATTSRPETP